MSAWRAGRDRCPPIGRRLALFVGGDLDAADAGRVRSHLRGCASCRGRASALLQAHRTLRAAAECPAPAGVDEAFFARLHGRVMERVREAGAPAVPVRARGRTRLLGALAAASLFASGLLLTGGSEPGLLDRSAIRAPDPPREAPARRPALQPLSFRPAGERPGAGFGLMGRLQLRTLEDERVLPLPSSWFEPAAPAAPERPGR